MHPQRVVVAYFVIQALAIFGWWGAILYSSSFATYFQPTHWPRLTLLAFSMPDLLLLGGGSAMAAFTVHRGTQTAKIFVWGLALVVWYPTLYCITASILTEEAWGAAAAMTAMSGLTLSMATIVGLPGQKTAAFREVHYLRRKAVTTTAMQTVLFWGTFLWVLPRAIVEIESTLGLNRFEHWGQAYFSTALFVLASAAGLWSGWSMSWFGMGTPLPTATASKLVMAGPYRYLRNPMALAGILQGVAVGWSFGSVAVIGYALCGIPVWHLCVRPSEEADLLERFGAEYSRYRKSVPLWLPFRQG